jgi:hypothetical protein
VELSGTPLLRGLVNKVLLVCLYSLQAFVPQAFRRPWSYPELVALSFFAEDATIHEVLFTVLKWLEEGRDRQRGDDTSEPGFLLLGDGKEKLLCHFVDDHEYSSVTFGRGSYDARERQPGDPAADGGTRWTP